MFNTGMTLIYDFQARSPLGPKSLVPSKNSAFCIHRKRTRDELSFEEVRTYKLQKIRNEWWDDNTISSNSSITSLPPKDKIEVKSIDGGSISSSTPIKKRDEKLVTKTRVFEPYLDLSMKTRQDFYENKLKEVGSQWVRGRKRVTILNKANSIKDLINDIILPEWTDYLTEKRDKENNHKNIGVRSDAVWKKIMRDCREFYRILFKHRFHRMDYQEHEQKLEWIQVLIDELGLPQFCDENLIYSFNFFHQIHLSEKNKAKYLNILSECATGFDALNRYTNESRTMFLEDPLCSRLLYFLYRNYLDFYFQLLSKNIKGKVEECILHVLSIYENVRGEDDVIPTSSLPI